MAYQHLSKTQIATLLKHAIDTDEIFQVYQPKICALTNKIVGVETLVRWITPQIGYIPPSIFIPIAEQSGLIESLTKNVIANAIRQRRLWEEQNIDVNVAINVSVLDLSYPDIVSFYFHKIQEYNVDPSNITFEITETAVMEDREQCAATLATVRAMGTKISVDDFGTGHASFIYLKHFPITEIKIDQLFVKDVSKSSFDTKLVRCIVNLAHDIGCKVVAEGVEDARTANDIRLLDVDILQGYYFSKPVSANEISILVNSYQKVNNNV